MTDNDQIEILDIEERSQTPVFEIEGVVGQILIDEHTSATGTYLYNEEGR